MTLASIVPRGGTNAHVTDAQRRIADGKGETMSDLNFYWRMGDYGIQAVPKRLARFNDDEPNETIELVKYYQHKGRECLYTIGYFYYNTHEPCWELKFCGGRFKDVLESDLAALFKMLAAAYDTLEEWSASRDE